MRWLLLAFSALLLPVALLVPVRLKKFVEVNVSHQDIRVPSSWWEHHVDDVARIYVPWEGNKTWCVPRGTKRLSGLYFVKIQKCASSTGAGINLRIAHNVAARQEFFDQSNSLVEELGKRRVTVRRNGTIREQVDRKFTFRRYGTIREQVDELGSSGASCNSFQSHGGAFRNRRAPFLLWTMLRHPAKRALSHFFHVQVSRNGVEPTSQNMIAYLEECKNFATLKMQESQTHNTAGTTALIISTFHFIAIMERMEESLVVMKLLFGLDDGDIIVMPAKQSGSFDDICTRIQKSFTTPEVDDYLHTTFPVDNYDYLLYAAANRSLDLTIEALGRRRVKEEVKRHAMLASLVQNECASQAVFPCSANGTLQREKSKHSCYFNGWGCGYKCVDRFMRKYKTSKKAIQD